MSTPTPQPKPFKRNWTVAIFSNLASLSVVFGFFYCNHTLLGFLALSAYFALGALGAKAISEAKERAEAELLKNSAAKIAEQSAEIDRKGY